MTKKNKSIQFNFLLTKDLYEKLEIVAEQNYTSKSTILRQMILEKFNKIKDNE